MSELDNQLQQFISKTGKSKVAVIIPLYGYWKDIQDNPLNLQTLKVTLDRVVSSVHQLYIFFVGESARVPDDIQNYILTNSYAGNSKGIQVEVGSSYADYIREGMRAAAEDTDAAYFIVLNPWNLIQRIGIDVMVDRMNYGDSAKIVSGYDLRSRIQPDNFNPDEFEHLLIQLPKETREMNINFFGMTRYALEMTPVDPTIKTSQYLERDMWQNMYSRGYDVISSQRLPMFVFDVSMEVMESPELVAADKVYFQSKWGFVPNL